MAYLPGSSGEGTLCSFRPLYGERAPGNLLEGLWFPQEQANPGCTSIGGHRAKLRRGSSSRSPRNRPGLRGLAQPPCYTWT